jgi:Hemerythrin HHE cation binding domain
MKQPSPTFRSLPSTGRASTFGPPAGTDMTEPEVSAPAVMRNYHEVLRNDLGKVLPALIEAGDFAAFATAWRAYTKAIAVHAAMEDGVEGAGGGSAAMLDHYFDGAAGAAMFKGEHVEEHAMQAAVTRAVPQGMGAVRAAFAAYRACAEAHLKHEEDIMMPLVARLPNPKAPLFAHWCVGAGIAHGDFEHFISHGVASLAAHGSANNTPAGATRVFVHALKAVCTPDQWMHFLPVARAAASPAIWAAIVAEVPSLDVPALRAA